MNQTKKMLDKASRLWYNIRTRYGKGEPTMDEYIDELSLNEVISCANNENIVSIGNTIREVIDNNFPDLRYPIIAGGSVRDTVFGVDIKDYDVFFDVSSLSDDDKNDVTLLILALTCEKLAEDGSFAALDKSEYRIKEGHYNDAKNTPFIVYENVFRDSTVFDVPLEQMQIPDRDEYPTIQLIGHDNSLLTEDPMKFVESFDYPLVRCYYDLKDSNFHFHPTFKDAIKRRVIEYKSDVFRALEGRDNRTANRIGDFIWKLRREGRDGIALADSFTIVRRSSMNVPVPQEIDIDAYILNFATNVSNNWLGDNIEENEN